MGKTERDVTGLILLSGRGEILLQKKDMRHPKIPGVWCLFGGSIETGESPQEAALREYKEEMSISTDLEFYRSYFMKNTHTHPRDHEHFDGVEHLFIGASPNLRSIRLNEGAGFALFSFMELPEIKNYFIRYDQIMEFLKNSPQSQELNSEGGN
tara:strand:- start:85 stop:546 length:462 start_codon:yes stop_codon:yes gene_type:complete